MQRFFAVACDMSAILFIFAVKIEYMATILNIETSGTTCSAALTAEGMIVAHREDFEGRNHATLLSGFVKHCLDYAREH